MSSSDQEQILGQLENLVRGLGPEDRLELIERMTGGPAVQQPGDEADFERLRGAFEAYSRRYEFRPGQLVRWKPGLRNKSLPEYSQSGVVIEPLGEAVVSSSEPVDSPYFRERLDLVLGVIDGDGDLAFLHVDSQRFEPADDPQG